MASNFMVLKSGAGNRQTALDDNQALRLADNIDVDAPMVFRKGVQESVSPLDNGNPVAVKILVESNVVEFIARFQAIPIEVIERHAFATPCAVVDVEQREGRAGYIVRNIEHIGNAAREFSFARAESARKRNGVATLQGASKLAGVFAGFFAAA